MDRIRDFVESYMNTARHQRRMSEIGESIHRQCGFAYRRVAAPEGLAVLTQVVDADVLRDVLEMESGIR